MAFSCAQILKKPGPKNKKSRRLSTCGFNFVYFIIFISTKQADQQ
jgi:hypothetical protein